MACSSAAEKETLPSAATSVFELRDAAYPDEGGRDPRIPQHPGDRHLGQRLPTRPGEIGESPHVSLL
jgi:hypothetical protein